MNTTLDRIPVAHLIQQYGKTKLYTKYFKELGITPVRDGTSSFITAEEERLVQDYHQVKSMGGEAIQAFLAKLKPNGSDRSELVPDRSETFIDRPEPVSERSLPAAWLMFVEAVADRLSPPSPDPLLPQRQLQEIADRGWTVTTAQLKHILGTTPREGERMGFHFVKVGAIGRQQGWRVVACSTSKLSN